MVLFKNFTQRKSNLLDIGHFNWTEIIRENPRGGFIFKILKIPLNFTS